MSNIKFSMSRTKIKPLKDIECCFSESPVYKCFKFKDERNRHKSFECNVVHNMIAIHEEVTFFHFSNTISYLKCTDPEVAAVEQVE